MRCVCLWCCLRLCCRVCGVVCCVVLGWAWYVLLCVVMYRGVLFCYDVLYCDVMLFELLCFAFSVRDVADLRLCAFAFEFVSVLC